MEIKSHRVKVFGKECRLDLMHFTRKDGKEWKKVFDLWKKLKLGLRKYKSREPNLPEGLSEVAFCIWSGSGRFIDLSGAKVSGSFDTYNIETNKAEQIKACSIDRDLTSFGPKSKWDDLYFLDFYNNNKTDGYFDVYLIPSKYLRNRKLNRSEKFIDQQTQKRRPRLSIKEDIVRHYRIKPLAKVVKVW